MIRLFLFSFFFSNLNIILNHKTFTIENTSTFPLLPWFIIGVEYFIICCCSVLYCMSVCIYAIARTVQTLYKIQQYACPSTSWYSRETVKDFGHFPSGLILIRVFILNDSSVVLFPYRKKKSSLSMWKTLVQLFFNLFNAPWTLCSEK